jgi:rSAM-associated Gly-rich repeat protein
MATNRRSLRALASLLPASVFSASVSLAAADAKAIQAEDPAPKKEGVASRLQAIRNGVSVIVKQTVPDGKGGETQLAWWGNRGGWGNGGHWPNFHAWGNGGWGNGGWNNWGNGGWGNGLLGAIFGGPWSNWHNGFRNW